MSLYAEVDFNTEFRKYLGQKVLSSETNYYKFINKDWYLNFSADYRRGKNSNPDKEDKHSIAVWRIGRRVKNFSSSFLLKYDYYNEKGSPSEQEYYYEKMKKAVGLNFIYSAPFDLVLNSETFYYFNEDKSSEVYSNEIESRGFSNNTLVKFPYLSNNKALFSSLNFYFKRLDFEDASGISYLFDSSLIFDSDSLHSKINTGHHERKIFEKYMQTDIQKKTDFIFKANYYTSYYLILCDFFADVSYLRNKFDSKINGNFRNKKFEFGGKFTLPISIFNTSLELIQDNSDYDYTDDNNDSKEKNRHVNAEIGFSRANKDTVSVRHEMSLKQTDLTDATSRTDRDVLRNKFTLKATDFIRDNILLRTIFSRTESEYVYLFSEMSGENKTRESYLLSPELIIFPGLRWVIKQEYRLQTDYDLYSENQGRNDRFFRRIEAKYSVGWDESFGFVNGAGIQSVYHQEIFAYPKTVMLGYEFHANNSGEKISDIFETSEEKKYGIIWFEIWKSYKNTEIYFNPRFYFTENKEFHLNSYVEYFFNYVSSAKLTLNPIYDRYDKISWKIFFNFNYSF